MEDRTGRTCALGTEPRLLPSIPLPKAAVVATEDTGWWGLGGGSSPGEKHKAGSKQRRL